MDEDIGAGAWIGEKQASVGVSSHQVRGRGAEGEEASVVADSDVIESAAISVALYASAGHADSGGRSGQTVVDEDVSDAVGVAQYQVRGEGMEGDEAAIRADGGKLADTVSLSA